MYVNSKMLIIEWELMKKPYLGGWVHSKTGVQYLNGDSQTGPPPRRIPIEKTCSRYVQTIKSSDKDTQTAYAQATQMWRRDCYIPSNSDKYLTSKPYETFEEQNARLNLVGKAIIIQKCWRAYYFLKMIKQCAAVFRKLRVECNKLEEAKFKARRERYLKECYILNHPRTVSDVDAVMSYYEHEEIGKGPELKRLSPRSRGLKQLDEWCRTSLTINSRMRRAIEQRQMKARERFLAENCKPKRWVGYKGKMVEMVSLRNQAAVESWNLYQQLKGDANKTKERMELLLKARSLIENHLCRPANTLKYLLDQEIQLISTNVEQSKIGFLRKRLIGAFLQFARTAHNCTCQCILETDCSPNSEDYGFREPLERDRLFCISCSKLLSRSKFPITSRKLIIQKCKACVRLHDNVRGHIDLKPFAYIITSIRQMEVVHGLADSLVDAMSASDIRYLVLDIWHGHSVLSERSDLAELRMPRYCLDKPWSPWNTILLTEDEAETHYCVAGGHHYAEHLQKKIQLNQQTAKVHFRGLIELANRLEMAYVCESESPMSSECENEEEEKAEAIKCDEEEESAEN